MEKTLTQGRAMPHTIHLAITEHGAWRVLAVAAMTLLRTVFAPVEADPTERLSEHLRRDIGLPPRGSPLPEAPMLPVRW
ncbi:hypothetical protein C0V75_07655 [Tabrizicola sp. TH137]|uniref:hypothetical protein n=1 Tax=Tabrizicola sp. TH137 TaxID=2067452 RepID=UPI000C7E855E|nr:hypothetical protein [Tabrizicola sp. TH137]PLL13269.1 hypothetical protein C0V75_07655 [Tabrizicola sp. TH137]